MPKSKQGLAPHVALQQIDDLTCLRIEHPRAHALIALQGAQVLEFTPTGQQPVIWLSPDASFQRGQSVRGGIPVCWPWFGDLGRNPTTVRDSLGLSPHGAPAHGTVRGHAWLLQEVEDSADGVRLRLDYPTPAGLPVTWAAQASLRLDLHIGDQLRLALTTHNSGSTPITLSQALHSYFAVSHIDQVQVQGLEDVRYLDTIDGWREKRDSAPLPIQRETDRIYLDAPPRIRIQDSGWQRTISIESRSSRSAVVWNPWIDKSLRLSQFSADAYQRMLLVHAVNSVTFSLPAQPTPEFGWRASSI